MKIISLKKYMAAGSLLILMTPSLSYAADGVVNFSGSISDVTCDINGKGPGEGNVTNVELGKFAPSRFVSIGTPSDFVPFKLQLSGASCKNDSKVSIAFDQVGNVDSSTGNLKPTGRKNSLMRVLNENCSTVSSEELRGGVSNTFNQNNDSRSFGNCG